MRYGYLILFAAVLALPFVLRRLAIRDDRPVVPAGGAARLVIVTPHNSDIRREVARAFEQWYQSHYGKRVVLDYRAPGGTTDMVRFLKGVYQPHRDARGQLPSTMGDNWELSVVWGGGDYTFYHDLEPLGILQPMRLSPGLLHAAFPQDSLAGVRLFDATKNAFGDPAPKWVGVVLSSFGIVYNQQLYSTLGLSSPRAWADLTDPRLFGFVALADPAHSGSASVSYMMVLQRSMADDERALLHYRPELKNLTSRDLGSRADYRQAIAHGWKRGMGQLLLIAANARYFSDSSELVPNDVARGEAAAGMAIDFYARVTEGTVGPERARFISPFAATAITPDPVGILYGASGEQLILATHFVEFLLSSEGQRLWILLPGNRDGPSERSLRRMPIRRDVYQAQTGWADRFNPFEEAGGFNQRGEWMALMGDTLPFWEAAWIDSRDALIDTYSKILLVRDVALRERLLSSLADLPVTLHDVEDRRAARLKLQQSHGDVDEWNARQRIQWGNRFRRHYQDVASQT